MKREKSELETWLRVGAVAAAWLWLYHDVVRRLLDDWRVDENYSHGFLVPLIASYALWQRRAQIAAAPGVPRLWWGAGVIVAATLLLAAGVLTGELYAARLALVLSLIGLALYFGGAARLRELAFPIGVLLLAIPIPSILFNQIAFPLQLLASDLATRAIRLCGVPALREGNVIELAQMKLQVVEACSGIRSLMSLTTLAVVYGYFFEQRWWRRVVLLAAVIPLALLTNAARVAGTGVLAAHWGERAAEGFLHSFSGALVFLIAAALLLALAQALTWLERLREAR